MPLYVSANVRKCKNKVELQLKGVLSFVVGLWVSAGEEKYCMWEYVRL